MYILRQHAGARVATTRTFAYIMMCVCVLSM